MRSLLLTYFTGGWGRWGCGPERGATQQELGEQGPPSAVGQPLRGLGSPGDWLAMLSVVVACYLGGASQLSSSLSSFTLLLTHQALVSGCWFSVKAGVKSIIKDKSAPKGL